MPTLKESLLEQIDSALVKYVNLPYSPNTNIEYYTWHCEFAYGAVAAVERAVGSESYRAREAHKAADVIVQNGQTHLVDARCEQLAAILTSIRNEVEAGYLDSTQVLVHADMFNTTCA